MARCCLPAVLSLAFSAKPINCASAKCWWMQHFTHAHLGTMGTTAVQPEEHWPLRPSKPAKIARRTLIWLNRRTLTWLHNCSLVGQAIQIQTADAASDWCHAHMLVHATHITHSSCYMAQSSSNDCASLLQELPPERMEALILAAGRIPQQRTTSYAPSTPAQRAKSFGAQPLAPLVMA